MAERVGVDPKAFLGARTVFETGLEAVLDHAPQSHTYMIMS